MSFGRFPNLQSPLLKGKAANAFPKDGHSSSATRDGSGSTNLDFAPNLLEAFIPGYSIISKFILQALGFDIGIIVSIGLLLVTFGTTIRFLYNRSRALVLDYCVSSIHVLEGDDMFENVLSWISQQNVGKRARSLKAVSKYIGDNDEDELEDNEELFKTQLFHTGRMAKVPPKYEPYFGSYNFFHKGRVFVFERGRRERAARSPWDRQMEEQNVILKTLGWSTRPIKELLQDIKAWASETKNDFTVIRRPSTKERGRQGAWARQLERPSRPMETVVLDTQQKARLIADVHEYLLPSTRKWYARRGIPYRRGYLFHGPPGTGKSSLSFALAGLFGLEVFLISLLDPTLSENDLMALFNHLPRRCIVILEDIDAAGLKRHGPSQTINTSLITEQSAIRPNRAALVVPGEEPSVGISMSGLLNAIDGVSSHEGHVLVMTSNFPERLDSAMTRPGRIDMKIEFTLATQHQTREIFLRMFSDETSLLDKIEKSAEQSDGQALSPKIERPKDERVPLIQCNGANAKNHQSTIEVSTQDLLRPLLEQERTKYTRAKLQDLADNFVSKVPEKTFSPAEVQNFLIPRKKDPWQAVDEVETWVEEMKKAKREPGLPSKEHMTNGDF